MVNTVTTYDNHTEKRSDCVFIRGKYFHKDRDCFFHDGLYYSPLSRYIVLDNESGKRVHMAVQKMEYGVIDIQNDDLILGYFSPRIDKNGYLLIPSFVSNDKMLKLLSTIKNSEQGDPSQSSYAIQDNNDDDSEGNPDRIRWVETPGRGSSPQVRGGRIVKCMNTSVLLHKNDLPHPHTLKQSRNSDVILSTKDNALYSSLFKMKDQDISATVPYNFELAYNSETMMNSFQEIFNYDILPRHLQRINALNKYLKEYSFGIEYETWDGRIPTYKCALSGLIPLKDGSLRHDSTCGYEYATVVMNKDKGLNAIKSQCAELLTYTEFNEKCSMHIHVGNIPRTMDNLSKLYQAFYLIQDSLYKLFPSCLKSTSFYKSKDYCSDLPDLGENSPEAIINFLSGESRKTIKEFGKPHPKDPNMQSKWHVDSRYKIVNFNNFYFTQRGTVELRISTATFNYNKVAALLILFCLIIDNAQKDRYFKNVEDIIGECMGGEEQIWMLNYIKFRQKECASFKLENNGLKYFETMENDNLTGNTNVLY